MSIRSLSTFRKAAVVGAVAAALAAVQATAAVKPALTLQPNGSVSTTGTLATMDEGQNWTPTRCGAATPSADAPLYNSGQCDVIPVALAMPKNLPADLKIGITATVSYPQAVPVASMQVCVFDTANETAYACHGGSTTFDSPAAATLVVSPLQKNVSVVVDQRVGYNTSYTLTVAWQNLNSITKLTVKVVKSGSTATLTGTLLDEKKKPVVGQTIRWTAGTKLLGTSVTDKRGVATLKNVAAGQSVLATFAGTDKYTSSSSRAKT